MKTVVIGTGRMGRRHIQVVRELGLELVGVCDQKLEALQLAEQEQKVPSELHFTDVPTMINRTRPECVIVATTAPTHCEYTCLAAELGAKFILCEKPMAVSLSDCDRMITTCQQHHVKLAVNHQMRFMEQYVEPKRIAWSDAFGGLMSVTVVAGNFGLAMNGTHYFEMFRYMTNENTNEVTAWFSEGKVANPRGPQFEDRAGSVRLTTSQGKRFYLDSSVDHGHGVVVTYAGPYGHIVVDELAGVMHTTVREEQYRSMPTTRYGMPNIKTTQQIRPADAIEPTRLVLQALLADNDYPTGEDGRLAVEVLVAAYVSDENGHCPVKIDAGNLPRNRVFPWA